MKFSPNKKDTLARAIYGICFLVSIALMFYHPSEGPWSSILSSVSLVTLFIAMVVFIKYDCTAYEYVLIERNGTLDFFVNRIVGKKGNYCAYFPLTDCIEIGEYSDEVRASIRAKYQDSRFSKYVQNFVSGSGFYYALFKGEELYDCIIIECDEAFVENMKKFLGKPPIITFDEGETSEISIEIEDIEQ